MVKVPWLNSKDLHVMKTDKKMNGLACIYSYMVTASTRTTLKIEALDLEALYINEAPVLEASFSKFVNSAYLKMAN
jgi:hypothetical protein